VARWPSHPISESGSGLSCRVAINCETRVLCALQQSLTHMSVVKGRATTTLPLPRERQILFRVECTGPAMKTLDKLMTAAPHKVPESRS
jgi:hypothetical protein